MTENELKLNNITVEIKRNYQQASANLEKIQKETAEALNVKRKVEDELAIERDNLNQVKNDISQSKLEWATYKHDEMVKLEAKNSEADNVLKRKAELNEQEQVLRDIESNTIQARNETRELELKIEERETALTVRENDLNKQFKQLEQDKLKIKKDQEAFKEKVGKVLQEVENI